MRRKKIEEFDPNGVGVKNGRFIGLPFSEEESEFILLPVPWDVTVSFSDGTATSARNILEASYQLDLYDEDGIEVWKRGIFLRNIDPHWLKRNKELRAKAKKYIDFLEAGGNLEENREMRDIREEINSASNDLKKWVYNQTKDLLDLGKTVGIIGGEHSVPLGFLRVLAKRHSSFGILQIDAHQDLRRDYEGFIQSHASIMSNVLDLSSVEKIVQVGIRDRCEEEKRRSEESKGRVKVFTDSYLKEQEFLGRTFFQICEEIVQALPLKVYISFDVDGLDPKLCPGTGTPVPGGLQFQEATFLLRSLARSGREIIGFDLCEVAGEGKEWDGNVGARLLYNLCTFTAMSESNREG